MSSEEFQIGDNTEFYIGNGDADKVLYGDDTFVQIKGARSGNYEGRQKALVNVTTLTDRVKQYRKSKMADMEDVPIEFLFLPDDEGQARLFTVLDGDKPAWIKIVEEGDRGTVHFKAHAHQASSRPATMEGEVPQTVTLKPISLPIYTAAST